MSEANKELARRFYQEIFNAGNMAVVEEMVTSDFVDHNPPGPGMPGGSEGLKAVVGLFRTAFPDLALTVEDQLAEGDKVMNRFTARGTHQGELMGIPATGKPVAMEVVEYFRIQGGKLAERWGQADLLGMMVQLGVVPPPGG